MVWESFTLQLASGGIVVYERPILENRTNEESRALCDQALYGRAKDLDGAALAKPEKKPTRKVGGGSFAVRHE